jgi:hypothetical protein
VDRRPARRNTAAVDLLTGPDSTAATDVADVLASLDRVWRRITARRAAMTQDEFVWQPVQGCWTVHDTDTGPRVDGAADEPDPAPVTTIAWREWHIAVDCLDSYAWRLFQRTGTGLVDTEWVVDVEQAADLLDRAWRNFRDGVAGSGEGWLFEPLGARWGPFANETRLALVLFAQDEVVHHGAEIALLRDLYAARRS